MSYLKHGCWEGHESRKYAVIRKTGNTNIFRLPCFYVAIKQYTYRTYNSLMEVELDIEKFKQDTMSKFSVYQKDETFGAKGIISLSLFRTIPIFCIVSYKNQKLQFFYVTKYLYCPESLYIPNIDYGCLDYSLANFYLIEGFYRDVSPLNVT